MTFSCWPQWQDHWVGPEVFVMPAFLDFSRFLSLFLQFSCQFSELPDILLIHSSLAILLLHYSYFWYLLLSHFRREAFNGTLLQCRSISPPITNFFFLQNTYISMIKHSWKWLFDLCLSSQLEFELSESKTGSISVQDFFCSFSTGFKTKYTSTRFE